MYRLNYPDDPGMHNPWSGHYPGSRTDGISSFRQELRSNWLSLSLVGIIIAMNVAVMIWNERHAVYVHRSLNEGLYAVRKLRTADVAFDENDQKLVHVYGRLTTDRKLTAPDYGISIQAVKLRRRVEMYQWFEEKGSDDDDDEDHMNLTSYSYYKIWHPEVILSEKFRYSNDYVNPTEMPINESLDVADVVKVGCFTLSSILVDRITHFQPFTGHIRPLANDIKLHAGLYYHTDDVWNPQIGDFRVEFAHAGLAGDQADMVSVIAKQDGQKLEPFVTNTGDEVLILHFGRKSPEEMFHVELAPNTYQLWGLRLTTYIVMFLAVNGAVNLLDSMVFRSSIVRDFLHLGITFLNFTASTFLYVFVMAINWIQYNVLFGLLLLVISFLPLAYAMFKLYRLDSIENRSHRKA